MYFTMPFSANDADNWQAFERLVADEVGKLDANVTVEHDAKLLGVHSRVQRQVDVMVTVPALGSAMRVAFECKLYKRAVSIGTVEEFIGKLNDLEVDRGVFCVFGSLTPAAFRRLAGVLHPRIDIFIWHRGKPDLLDRQSAFEEDNLEDMTSVWEERMTQVRNRWYHWSIPSLRL